MARTGVLGGATVIDCSELLPGPYATRTLAALGARVIKVERPDYGDRMRSRPEMFEAENRGKESIALDLKRSEGVEILKSLIKSADVFIEGYRPGVLDKLGLGFEQLSGVNPKLIYVSLSGYGASGPYRDLPGHDFQYLSFAGAIPQPDPAYASRYVPTSLPVADMSSSLFTVMAVVLALFEKTREPDAFVGRHVDVAMADCALALMEPRIAEAVGFTDSGDALRRPAYGVYATKDGRFVTLGAIEDHFFKRLVDALSIQGMNGPQYDTFASRRQVTEDIESRLRARVLEFDRDELISLLTERDVPVAPVYGLDEPLTDSHFRDRGMVYKDPHGVTRVSEWPLALNAFASREFLTPSPILGESTRAVLSSFGFTEDTVSQFVNSNIVRTNEE